MVQTTDCLEAVAHLPAGAALVLHQFSWDDYEKLVEMLDRRSLRTTYVSI